jgi:hypothetical protein
VKEKNINMYHTHSIKKSSIVERVIRTIKSKMFREMSFIGKYSWIGILDKVIQQYNFKDIHRTIKTTPAKVRGRRIEKHLQKTVYNQEQIIDLRCPFKLNQAVRISKYRTIFAKGYEQNYTSEIFYIDNISLKFPCVYKLRDYGEKILGKFYRFELIAVKYPDVFLVEKILKKSGNRVYVKFSGYKKPEWINKSEVV